MSVNLFPKSIFQWKNADGSTTTAREYDFETFASLELAHYFIMLVGSAVIGVFLAPLLFLFSLLSFSGGFNIRFLFTGLMSGYVMFDANNGWLMLRLLDIVFEESTLGSLISLNTGVFYCSLVLFLLGGIIHSVITRVTDNSIMRWVVFLVVSFVIFRMGYSVGKSNIGHEQGWVTERLGNNVQEPTTQDLYRNMTDEQIRDEAQQDYEDQLRKEGRDPKEMEDF